MLIMTRTKSTKKKKKEIGSKSNKSYNIIFNFFYFSLIFFNGRIRTFIFSLNFYFCLRYRIVLSNLKPGIIGYFFTPQTVIH